MTGASIPAFPDREAGMQEINGAELNARLDAWKAEVYAAFPGAQIVDAITRNEAERTSKFVALAAYVEQRQILAVWVAEASDVAREDDRFRKPVSVSIASRRLPEPTDPEALPDPFRALAIAAFAA